jgi:hypothetical protein
MGDSWELLSTVAQQGNASKTKRQLLPLSRESFCFHADNTAMLNSDMFRCDYSDNHGGQAIDPWDRVPEILHSIPWCRCIYILSVAASHA